MTAIELDILWETVRSLAPADRFRLRERIDASLTERPGRTVPTALDRVLLERGVITAVPQGVEMADYIIEERR
jgi:hypothetical protein